MGQPTPAPGAPAPEPTPTPAPTPPAGPAPAPPSPAPASAQTVDQLPDWAQKIVRDARSGEASYRDQLRQAQEQAKQHGELTQKVAAALGIPVSGAADPAKLTEQLTVAQAATRQSAVELAVWKTAATAGGNAEALLDSRTFLDTISRLDPASASFAKDVGDAIAAAVASNDRFKAAAGQAPAPTPNPAPFQGSADGGARGGNAVSQITEAELARMTPEQIVEAQAQGRLNDLLGVKT